MREQRFSDEDLIDCLQLAADELGGILTSDQFTEFGRERSMPDGRSWPTHQAAQGRWGSWRDALHAAGLRSNPRSAIAGNWLFSVDDCVDAVRAAARALGHAPTVTEYEQWSQSLNGGVPSASTIRKRVRPLRWSDVIAQL